MLIAIAWRNLWRNRRRTLSTVAAVAGGVAAMVIVSALMNAMSDRMVEAVTGSFMGHAQIHCEGYRTKRSPLLVIRDADHVLEAVRSTKGVEAASGRIYGSAHASIVRGEDGAIRAGGGEEIAAPVVVLLGVEPIQEKAVTDLEARIVEGRWLRDETDVVLSAGVAKRNGARIGDAFLPTSTDLDGATRGPWAVGDEVPRVVGIVRTGLEEIDSRTVLMTREYLAALSGTGDSLHEIAIRAGSAQQLESLLDSLRVTVGEARAGAGSVKSLPATRPLLVAAERSGMIGAVTDGGVDGAGPSQPYRLRLVGVQPGSEGEVRSPESPVVEGRFISRSEDVVLSAQTASALGVSPGDRVVVEVPVHCGAEVPEEECPPAWETFVVAGLVAPRGGDILGEHFALVAKSVVSGNIAALSPDLLSKLEGAEAQRAAALARQASVGAAELDEVLPWYGLAPEIRDILVVFDASPIAMSIVIFLAVAIGIINTLLMSTFERIKELGLMKAIGMRPTRIVVLVLAESAQLGLVGVVGGVALGMVFVWYWSMNGFNLGAGTSGGEGIAIAGIAFDPVLRPRIGVSDLIEIIIPVMIITTLAGLWPAIKAARIQVTDALRHE